MSHRKADDYVEVEITTDDFPITSAELKATYQDIIEYVLKKYNVKVTNLEIAQMKQKYGIKERECYNKGKDNSKYLVIDRKNDAKINEEIDNVQYPDEEEIKPRPAPKPIEEKGAFKYPRNPAISKQALENAKYLCECGRDHI